MLRDGLLDGIRCVSFVNIEDGKMDAVATLPIEDDALLRDFAMRTRRFLNNDDTNFGRVKNLLLQAAGPQSARPLRELIAAWDAPLNSICHTSPTCAKPWKPLVDDDDGGKRLPLAHQWTDRAR